MSSYHIAPGYPRDAVGVAKVQIDTWRTTYPGMMPQAVLDTLDLESSTEGWRSMIESRPKHWHLWVARDANKEIVGFSSGGKNRGTEVVADGEVTAIYLLKSHQRKGLGKELLLHSFEQLYRHGFRSAVIWVIHQNPARKFYEAMGGEIAGSKTDTHRGATTDEIGYLWKDLEATLRKYLPKLIHPNIKHYSEIQDPDGHSYYPGSDEPLSVGAAFGKTMGLRHLGVHHEWIPPGRRTSWPHAEEDEEEFIYVIEGTPDVWIDGNLHRLKPGDGVGFPSGTGVSHTFLNNSKKDVRLLVVGEASKKTSKIYYPYHPGREKQVGEAWWREVPKRPLGPHDGVPDAQKKN